MSHPCTPLDLNAFVGMGSCPTAFATACAILGGSCGLVRESWYDRDVLGRDSAVRSHHSFSHVSHIVGPGSHSEATSCNCNDHSCKASNFLGHDEGFMQVLWRDIPKTRDIGEIRALLSILNEVADEKLLGTTALQKLRPILFRQLDDALELCFTCRGCWVTPRAEGIKLHVVLLFRGSLPWAELGHKQYKLEKQLATEKERSYESTTAAHQEVKDLQAPEFQQVELARTFSLSTAVNSLVSYSRTSSTTSAAVKVTFASGSFTRISPLMGYSVTSLL